MPNGGVKRPSKRAGQLGRRQRSVRKVRRQTRIRRLTPAKHARRCLGLCLLWTGVFSAARPESSGPRQPNVSVAPFSVTGPQRETGVRHHRVGFRLGVPAWIQHRRGQRSASREYCAIFRTIFSFAVHSDFVWDSIV